MGLGKTIITLTAIERLIYDSFEASKVLVIAPLRVAADTWVPEKDKWDHLAHLRISKVLGSLKEREEALAERADVYVINRENVPWLVKYYGAKWPFDMVVIDELSSFKSAKSQRFKALKSVRGKISRIVGLTGTPTPNGLMDLWAQINLLDGGKRLGRFISTYRDAYFLPDKRNRNVIFSYKLKPGAEEQIYDRIGDLCISMRSEDYLTLPECMYVRHEIQPSPKAEELYQRMKRDMILPLKDSDIDAGSAAVLTNKLMQIAGGCAYDENGQAQVLHDDKLDYFDDLIEQANGQPVLVFYAFKHERDRIKERHPEAVDLKEEGVVEKWNRGEISILLAHPASAAFGLNLQSGGHILIWYGLPLSLELYQQANKRLHRNGQKDTVLIHHLLMKGTIDERVLDQILTEKQRGQDALLDAIKAEIETEKGW